MKKLWILRPKDSNHSAWGYDCAYGFVVRAESEEIARQLANDEAGDEAKKRLLGIEEIWKNSEHTTCEELLQDGDSEVILRDFLDG